MDPLSACSLACNVIQVVDFSIEVVRWFRELYKDGNLSQHKEVEEMAFHLTQLETSLNPPVNRDQDQDELWKLGGKCSATAKDLVTELQKLKVCGPHKKRQVFGKTFKTIWKKTTIDGIQKKLDSYRDLLDHRILMDLRKGFDMMCIQQSEGFENLDSKVQIMITHLIQGAKTFEELKSLIRSESHSFKEHVTNELQRHQRDLAHKEHCQSFLNSLWFPEIYRRQETIHEAYEKTFQWIYAPEEPGKAVRQWDNFVHWLESGQHTYWIYGKAGSGKSTLINYIVQDPRTVAALRVWAEPKEILMPGVFFWNAGECLEKSSEGLLRSLIYQILKKFPGLTPSTPIVSSSGPMQHDSWDHEPIAAWTERRLLATSESVLRQAQETCRICIFIDGLDEFSGNQDALLELIKKVQTADIKVCLSSRPYRLYGEAFGSSAKLQLQDLTEPDIKRYVSDKLYPLVKAGSATEIYHLCDAVARKAEGVFLWVELVVNGLIKGLKNDDTLEQLQDRLSLMPSGIENLYTHMLNSIDTVYRAQAAKMFRMALSHDSNHLAYERSSSLLTLALDFSNRLDKTSDIGLSDVIAHGEIARRKIPTICAGLLEVHPQDELLYPESMNSRSTISRPFQSVEPSIYFLQYSKLAEFKALLRRYHVEFIHRTAVDYFKQCEQGKQFLDRASPPDFCPYNLHVKALLTEANMLGFAAFGNGLRPRYSSDYALRQDSSARRYVYRVMFNAYLAERHLGTAQTSLCDEIDGTLSAIHSRRGLPSSKVLREITEIISVAERQNRPAQVLISDDYEHCLVHMNQQSCSKDHWSVRWGLDTDQHCVERDDKDPVLSSCSPSNSTHSFYSRSSSRALSTRPVDFVGLAAYSGLSHYVKQKLDFGNNGIDRGTANYLLCCSSGIFYRNYLFTAETLRSGGDPNIYVKDHSTTVWAKFLDYLWWDSDYYKSANATLTKVFLEHGADVHARLNRSFSGRKQDHKSLESQMGLQQRFHFWEEITALYVIQRSFGDMPEYKILEKHILDGGGISSSRYTHIALEGGKRHRISEQQSHDFKEALHGRDFIGDGGDESILKRRKCALQIDALYKEICGENEGQVWCSD